MKSTCSWPNWRSRPARSAATSVSRRPAKRTLRISPYVASAAAPAAVEPGQLVGVLDRPQHRQALGQRAVATCRAAASCRPSRCIAQAESEMP